jgi:predicted DNA-binding protein (MmcQ/YjbR family)
LVPKSDSHGYTAYVTTIDEIQHACLELPETNFDFPFDEVTMVFRVKKKMFALMNISESQLRINLKCNPDFAQELRSSFTAINPGYHMNKRHWNTITLDGSIDSDRISWLIGHSYDCVVAGLSKKEREE